MLFLNIRSFNTHKTFEILMDLNRRNYYAFIAPMEPFQDPIQVEDHRRKLGFNNGATNYSSKIYFWKEEWAATVILDTIQ